MVVNSEKDYTMISGSTISIIIYGSVQRLLISRIEMKDSFTIAPDVRNALIVPGKVKKLTLKHENTAKIAMIAQLRITKLRNSHFIYN
jgi:hypothetical protein